MYAMILTRRGRIKRLELRVGYERDVFPKFSVHYLPPYDLCYIHEYQDRRQVLHESRPRRITVKKDCPRRPIPPWLHPDVYGKLIQKVRMQRRTFGIICRANVKKRS